MSKLVWYCETCKRIWTKEPYKHYHEEDWSEECDGTIKPAALIPLEEDV